MKRGFTAVVLAASVCLVAYVGLFSYWWLSAKRSVAFVNGKRQVAVRVHQTAFMSHTQPIWNPAFWFMEHVGGYRCGGYIAAMEDSAFVYER